MKKKVVEFVAKFLDCQQVKAECKHPSNIFQTYSDTRMEMRGNFHGLHYKFTKDIETT